MNKHRVIGARERGVTLIEMLLALVLVALLIAAGIGFVERRSIDERARLAGVQLAALSEAAAVYANSHFPALLAQTASGPLELTVAELKTVGVLPAAFAESDALGRGYRLLVRAAGAGAFDLLVVQTVGAGDGVMPLAGLFESRGGLHLGLVAPEAPARLRGPALDADVSGFQADFAGAPAQGALGVLARFDHERVYGDVLYRVSVPGYAAANRMQTALDMGGNALENAGAIGAASLTLDGDFTGLGDMTISGALTVGEGLAVTGAAAVGGELSAETAVVAGVASADSVTVTGALEAGEISASGQISGDSLAAADTVTAGVVTVDDVTTDTLVAQEVSAAAVEAASVQAVTVQGTTSVDAAVAGFSQLTVGSCSGC